MNRAKSSNSFQLIADSRCNVPPWLLRRYDIQCIPVSYYAKDRPESELLFQADASFDFSLLSSELEHGRSFNASPLNGDLCLRFIESSLDLEQKNIFFLYTSAAGSAKEDDVHAYFEYLASTYPEHNFLAVDTLSSGLGFARLLMRVGDMRIEGCEMHMLAHWIKESRLQKVQWFIRGAEEPLLHLNNSGKLVSPPDQPTWDSLLEVYKQRSELPYGSGGVSIAHVGNWQAAQKLADLLDYYFKVENPMIYDAEPSLAIALGPKALALSFWGNPR